MTANISYAGYRFGQVQIESVHANAGIGHARWLFNLRFRPTPNLDRERLPETVEIYRGSIALGHFQKHIADLSPVVEVINRHSPHDELWRLDSTIRYDQATFLSASRKSEDHAVEVNLYLDVLVRGKSEPEKDSLELRHSIVASDFRRLATSGGWGQTAVFEVPYSGTAVPAALEQAGVFFGEALGHLQRAQWDDAIGDCRKVIEQLATVLTDPVHKHPPRTDWPDRAKYTAWTFAQRLAFVREAIRHTTHGPHHEKTSHSAAEATYVVQLAGACLRYYADSLAVR
jgi:hypothetical protein